MATHASRERFHAARERASNGPSLFDHRAIVDPPMSPRERRAAPSLVRCPCGPWPSVAAYLAHREAGECPYSCPEGAARLHWCVSGRRLSAVELERKEAARARLAELKANPEYQEHARAKREARKALRERQKGRR